MRRISIKVIPNAKVEKIEAGENGLKVWIKAKPIEGEANKRIVEVLSKYFQIPKSLISVSLGGKSRDKVIEIND